MGNISQGKLDLLYEGGVFVYEGGGYFCMNQIYQNSFIPK